MIPCHCWIHRQANWKLDPALRRACRADVADICKSEDDEGSETGLVYKCLLHNTEDLDPGCKKELGRAVHMAFFIWTPGGILTSPCDVDAAEVCLKQRPNMDRTPGGVGKCLAEVVSKGWRVWVGVQQNHAKHVVRWQLRVGMGVWMLLLVDVLLHSAFYQGVHLLLVPVT